MVITVPQKLKDLLHSQSGVRIRIPNREQMDLRLEITSAKYGGTGAMATQPDFVTLLCKIPGAQIVPTKRSSDRIMTSQYRDVFLELATASEPLPIQNMSLSGVKIRTKEEGSQEQFPLGASMENAVIRLGKKTSLRLDSVTPRCHYIQGVGLEMKVKEEGNYRKILKIFLETVELKLAAALTPEADPSPA